MKHKKVKKFLFLDDYNFLGMVFDWKALVGPWNIKHFRDFWLCGTIENFLNFFFEYPIISVFKEKIFKKIFLFHAENIKLFENFCFCVNIKSFLDFFVFYSLLSNSTLKVMCIHKNCNYFFLRNTRKSEPIFY